MEDIAVEYFPSSVDIGNKKGKSEFHSYISDENKEDACDSHAHMVHLLIFLESGRLVYGMSTVWEDIDGCAKQYRCALDRYLMTLLSYSYSIITDRANYAPGNGKNVVY